MNSIDRNLSVTELNERVKRLTVRIDEYMGQLDETDATEEIVDNVKSAEDVKAIINRLSGRKKKYESYLEELAANGETQKSLTDSEARLMKDAKGFDVSYNVQMSVDSKHKLVAEFNVTNDGSDMKQLLMWRLPRQRFWKFQLSPHPPTPVTTTQVKSPNASKLA